MVYTIAGESENLDMLKDSKGFDAALRKVGYPWESLQESENVVRANATTWGWNILFDAGRRT